MQISRQLPYFALIAASLLAMSATAQTEKNLKIWLKISNQDSPLQILGMKRELEPSYEPAVHCKNNSSKEVVGMLISVLIRSLDGKVGSTQSNMDGVSPSERRILPGGDVWAHETALRSTTFGMMLETRRSPCADARVVVERVTFANGTEWHRDSNKETDVWSDLQAASDSECKNTEITDEEWSEMTRVALDPKWSKEIEEENAKETSESDLVCGIRPLGRGLAPFCPR